MNKILQIILISLFSLTVISCSDKDNSSSSSSSIDNYDTSCPQTNYISKVSHLTSDTGSRSSNLMDKVLYVDRKALSNYSADPYLSLDIFQGFQPDGVKESFSKHEKNEFDRIDLSESAPSLSGTFTQEAWIYTDFTKDGTQSIFGPSPYLQLHRDPDQSEYEIRLGFNYSETEATISFAVPNIIKNIDWYHLAVTLDSEGNYTLLVNGEEIFRQTLPEVQVPLAIPTRFIGENFHGKIDDVRFWDLSRSAEQIKENMNKTLEGNEIGLVAYYPMDVNKAYSMILDKSTKANHAKIVDTQIFSKYFSSECSSGPDGSSKCPYPTILSALEAVRGKIHQGDYGHRIVIKEGRYPEVILLNGLNKNGQQVVIVEGETGKGVILDGTIELKADWNDDNGDGIYETVLDMDALSTQAKTQIEKIYGVFVDNRYMIPALPMNIKNPTDPTKGNYHNPEPGTVWSWHKEIFQLMGPDDNMTEGVVIGPDNRANWIVADPSNLDSLEEWAFDNESKKLYLYASKNFIPSKTNVRVRIRDRFVSINDSDKITLKNIHFFAGSLELIDSDYLTIEDSRFSFSSDIGLKIRKNYHTGHFHRLTNSIFEHINGAGPWTTIGQNARIENVLFQYNDWFNDSALYAVAKPIGGLALPEAEYGVAPFGGRNRSPDGSSHPGIGDESWYSPVWRYITIRDSWTAGMWPGRGSLVEYARFENLYDHCDCSGIQRNAYATVGSTTRYSWLINLPALNAIRFDSYKAGTFGEVHHLVSVGNRRGMRLKGDYHEVYQVTTYDESTKGIYNYTDRYSGFTNSETFSELLSVPGNAHSRLLNTIAQEVAFSNSPDFWPNLKYIEGRSEYDESLYEAGYFMALVNAVKKYPNFQIKKSGIWYGRTMTMSSRPDDSTYQDFKRPWSDPRMELEKPWQKTLSLPEEDHIARYGMNPFKDEGVYSDDGNFYGVQSYDFRPKKGSSLIDSGVIVPGLNDGGRCAGYLPHPDWGKEQGGRFFNHKASYPGQHRKYIGKAPDIGAYEYGDSVYWIPGFRYSYPSVPIPNDNATKVPLEYGLAWNYPYKQDYSSTKAVVTISGPGVNHTETFIYPNNVLFSSFKPNSTYTWSVSVDGVSGGDWTFTTNDRIYPLNDRSVDVVKPVEVYPSQKQNLEVSKTNVAFLRFDLPETIPGSYRLKLNLVPETVTNQNKGIGLYKFAKSDWNEIHNKKNAGTSFEINSNNNIGTLNHVLGELIHTFRDLKAGVPVILDITDAIGGSSGDFSLALASIGDSDVVSFYSKEKFLPITGWSTEYAGYIRGYIKHQTPDFKVMPSIRFNNTVLENEITPNGEGHALKVMFGSGDGFYHAGKQVTVRAMDHEGIEFVKWEVGDSLAILDENSPTTTVTIPAQDSVIRATFNYSEGNVFWTGLGGDGDITNPANWSNKLNPDVNDAWQASDLGVIVLENNGDGSHVLTCTRFSWEDGDFILKGDTQLNTSYPSFRSDGVLTLEDRSFLNVTYDFKLGPDRSPSTMIIDDNSRVEVGRHLALKGGSTLYQRGGKVMLTNIDARNIGSLKLYDNSVYSLSAGRIDIKVKRDNIVIKDASDSTHGYINFTADSRGEIFFDNLTQENIKDFIGTGGIRVDNASVEPNLDSYFQTKFNYNSAAKVLRLRNRVSPSVTGTTTQGELLTAVTDNITDAIASGNFSYQWFRGDSLIDNVSTATYRLNQADVGLAISVTVSYLDQQGKGQFLTSDASVAVASINDNPTGSVALSSYFPPKGRTLSVDTSTIKDPDGLGSFSYQWLSDGTSINGATTSTFTLTQDYVGKRISLSVSWSDGQGTNESLTSRATYPVR